MKAYTIGAEKSYDEALADKENPVHKIGRRPDFDPPYEGGWVWRTVEEALEFLVTHEESFGFTAAVYALDLPSTWDESVCPYPDTDGAHHLRLDVRILRKVANPQVVEGALGIEVEPEATSLLPYARMLALRAADAEVQKLILLPPDLTRDTFGDELSDLDAFDVGEKEQLLARLRAGAAPCARRGPYRGRWARS